MERGKEQFGEYLHLCQMNTLRGREFLTLFMFNTHMYRVHKQICVCCNVYLSLRLFFSVEIQSLLNLILNLRGSNLQKSVESAISFSLQKKGLYMLVDQVPKCCGVSAYVSLAKTSPRGRNTSTFTTFSDDLLLSL